MRKLFLIFLFLVGTSVAFGSKSESSCEENANKELVCSEEVIEIIKKENPNAQPPPKKKVAAIETTAAPPEMPERPELPEHPEVDYEYYDEYYDEY